MAQYEFKFVVTDVDLSDDVREQVSQALAEAGAIALSEFTGPDASTVRLGPGWWWRGIPPVTAVNSIIDTLGGEG